VTEPSNPSRTLGVAVVGYGWMGKAHTQAYLRLRHHYPELPYLRLIAVADPSEQRCEDALARYGFDRATTTWQTLITDPEIDIVSITAPNAFHREMGAAFAEAGKHIWIEKPMGLTADDARVIADAVAKSEVHSAVGFNYRNAPAVQHARYLIHSGAIGELTHARFRFFSDYAGHPFSPLSWRFQTALGGSGVLGDLMSHAVDLARSTMSVEFASIVGQTSRVITERPIPLDAGSHFDVMAAGGPAAAVENEDIAIALLRTHGGISVVLEASRVAVGDQNNYGFEIHGTRGVLRWDFRRFGELEVATGDHYANLSAATVFMGDDHGETSRFQPGTANAMGFDDTKVIELARLLEAITSARNTGATVEDGAEAARIVDALMKSSQSDQRLLL